MTARTALVACFSVIAVTGAVSLQRPDTFNPTFQPLTSPAAGESGEPQLSGSAKGLILSWVERDGQNATLKFATRTPQGWSRARTVASGTDWFVNWADVPSVIELADGSLVGHWLQKSGAGTYAYDVRLAYSTDGGATWSPSFRPHSDGTETEHGFASLLQIPRAGLGLLWLDGRETKPAAAGHHGTGAMTLRYGAFDRGWKQTVESAVDLKVCDCCPTAAAITSDGPIAVYRDRTDDEVRDISIVRLENGRWTAPASVHHDNWKLQACPVNGPAVAARGRDVVVAWFSAVGDAPRTFVAFSKDAGRTFAVPIRLDDGLAIGRVDVELLADGSAAASYIEHVDGRGQFRVRRIRPGGARSAPITIANIDSSRSSGYPRIAVHDGELTAAWVERAATRGVQTARAKLGAH